MQGFHCDYELELPFWPGGGSILLIHRIDLSFALDTFHYLDFSAFKGPLTLGPRPLARVHLHTKV